MGGTFRRISKTVSTDCFYWIMLTHSPQDFLSRESGRRASFWRGSWDYRMLSGAQRAYGHYARSPVTLVALREIVTRGKGSSADGQVLTSAT